MSPECEFPQSNATTDEIKTILRQSKIIAVVGLSPKPDRPSFGVSSYLQRMGYKIIPVNPGQTEILGEKAYARLRDVPGVIDIVDIFRSAEAVPEIVDDAIFKNARVIWMQEGIVHNMAADKARAAGLKVVMNKCTLKEHMKIAGG